MKGLPGRDAPLPQLKAGPRTTPAEAAWALTVMTPSGGVATPVVGRLGGLYGPREGASGRPWSRRWG